MFIGISGYFHDSSIALINNSGDLIDFKKEEWLSRIKGDKSFPRLALSEMIKNHNLCDNNIDYVCFYEKPLKAWLTILKHSIKNNSLKNEVTRNYFKNIWNSSLSFSYDLSKYLHVNNKKILYCDHHLSHTLSALYYNKKVPAVSVIVDGFGDESCTSIHHVKSSNEIENLWNSSYPNSLGLFYSAITDFLGFAVNEGEYKVMGLAAYGKPKYYDKLVKTISFKDGNLLLDDSYYDFVRSVSKSYSSKIKQIFEISERDSNSKLDLDSKDFTIYADIASSAQKVVEKTLEQIFLHANKISGEKRFLFSGGVAMNSVAINKLTNLDFIDEIIIPPSPGDSGAAIGAAYYGYIKNNNNELDFKKQRTENLTPGFKKEDFNDEDFFLINLKKIANKNDSLDVVADLLSKNEIIATCYGNIETGPRALGNRSLLCNAHSISAVEKLNYNIKQRSKFRPVAPVVLEEKAKDYFKISHKIYDCYYHMGAVANVINDEGIEGVVHIDNTARVQICNKNQLLGKILEKLKLKNIHVIANTSFNISSDPMVYSKEDAYLAIERMDIKYILTEKGLYLR